MNEVAVALKVATQQQAHCYAGEQSYVQQQKNHQEDLWLAVEETDTFFKTEKIKSTFKTESSSLIYYVHRYIFKHSN